MADPFWSGLDFYETIKFVNYIRSEVKNGNLKPDVDSKDRFQDEKYLQPALEDDALLFCLDDLDALPEVGATEKNTSEAKEGDNSLSRISDLEEQLQKLQNQFAEYRETVARTLDQRWEDSAPANGAPGSSNSTKQEKHDTNYFDSYSYNGMHENQSTQIIHS